MQKLFTNSTIACKPRHLWPIRSLPGKRASAARGHSRRLEPTRDRPEDTSARRAVPAGLLISCAQDAARALLLKTVEADWMEDGDWFLFLCFIQPTSNDLRCADVGNRSFSDVCFYVSFVGFVLVEIVLRPEPAEGHFRLPRTLAVMKKINEFFDRTCSTQQCLYKRFEFVLWLVYVLFFS